MTAQTNQKHRLAVKVIRLSLVTVVTSLLLSCAGYKHINYSVDENEGWTLVKTEKNNHPRWKAFSRKISGTNFIEYKLEGKVISSPEACLSSFKDEIKALANGSEQRKYPTYDIVHESANSLRTYVIHNEPFPLKDTEMSVRYLFVNYEDGTVGVNWHEAWDEKFIEPSNRLKRVTTFRGSWTFSRTKFGSTQAINMVQFDPQKMPRWLVEPMVLKFLKEGLEDIRKATNNSQFINVTHNSTDSEPIEK